MLQNDLIELVDWKVLTSAGTEVLVVLINGLSSVLSGKNEWVLVQGARGLFLLCHGMILTKSNIQRQIRSTSVKCEAKSPWKRCYSKTMQTMQSNIQAGKKAAKGKYPGGRLLERNSFKGGCKGRRLEINTHKTLVTIPIRRTRIDITAKTVVGCSWTLRFTKAPRRKILQKCCRALIQKTLLTKCKVRW